MRKKPAIAPAMILVIGVSSGSMMAASVGAQPSCTGTNHCVDGNIADGAIQPVPDTVVPGMNHQIYWQIRTSGYSFLPPPPPGIAFQPSGPANNRGRMPKDEFHCNRVSATVFHCTDANSTHNAGIRRYQYSITVMGASGHPIGSDPWIVNK